MTVTAADVRWAYRLLLGREPENPAVVEPLLALPDLAALRQVFLNSDEFRDGFSTNLPVGRYIDAPWLDIEVDCSADDLRRMLAQISGEWRRFGAEEPHWSVMVSDDFRAQNIAANLESFYATGRTDVAQLLNTVRRSRPAATFRRALDFGCGVGRLTLALAERVEEAVGIDISPNHLDWASRRAEETGVANVRFASIEAVSDLAAYRDIDLLISLIVLQHNPPPAMAAILTALLATLAPGGLAVVQIPTYMAGYSFSVDRYFAQQQPAMEMNVLPQHVVLELVARAGCRALEVQEDARIGACGVSHTFLIERSGG